jgi:hypothetical protein
MREMENPIDCILPKCLRNKNKEIIPKQQAIRRFLL